MAKDDKGKDEPTMNDVLTALAGLGEAMAGLPEVIGTAVQGGISKIQLPAVQQGPIEPREVETKEVDDADLERMSRSQLMDHMLKTIKQEVLTPVAKRLDEQEIDAQTRQLISDLGTVRDANPDFNYFKQGVFDILKANPGMEADDAFALAKIKSPDIVEKLTKEAEEEKAKKAEEEKDDADLETIVSLLPRSASPVDEDREGHMTTKEASDDAWDRTMKDVGSILGP